MSDLPSQTCASARDRHLFGPGPKRLLALDGGGVRGALAVAFLERIEDLLDKRMGHQVRLGDWFDLIGGTSTGAIIAGAIALGHRAADVRDFYLRLAPKVFSWRFRIPYVQAKFDARALRSEIDRIIADRTLGSPDLITGLAVITKRIDTGSPWIIANNPRSHFWASSGTHLGNQDYPLATLVRASTAAPTYFDPQILAIRSDAPKDPLGEIAAPFSGLPLAARLVTRLRALYGLISKEGPSASTHGLFIDGGVTPYNNPTMALLMLVVLKQFGICWELGPKNLQIISIGTGSFRTSLSFEELGFAGPLRLALRAMFSSIGDAQQLTVAQMQWLGECPQRRIINRELQGLEGNTPPGGPWFQFLRYDVSLEPDGGLSSPLGDEQTEAQSQEQRQRAREQARTLDRLKKMDSVKMIEQLYELGCKAADAQVKPEHLFGDQPSG